MKTFALLLLASLGIALLSGCSTLSQYDQNMLAQHHVSPTLSQRMHYREPLSLSDIIELSQHRLPNGFIIHYLSSTGAVYDLRGSQSIRLRKAGVSAEVIDYLADSAPVYSVRRSYYSDYAPYPYYSGIGYYGGPTVIVGGGYYQGGGCYRGGYHGWHH